MLLRHYVTSLNIKKSWLVGYIACEDPVGGVSFINKNVLSTLFCDFSVK